METCLPSQVVVNLTITSGGKLVSITCDGKFPLILMFKFTLLFQVLLCTSPPKTGPIYPLARM